MDIQIPQQQLLILRDALQDYQHGYYNASAEKLEMLIAAGRKNALANPDCMELLALVYSAQGKFQQADEILDELMSLPVTFPRDFVISIINTQAGIYHHQGHYERAAKLYEQALSLGEGTDHTIGVLAALVNVMGNYSDLLIRQGRHAEAEELLRKAIEFNNIVQDYEASIALNHNLSNLLLAQNRLQEAADRIDCILENMDSSHRLLPTILTNKGVVYGRLGNYDSAEAMIHLALQMHEKSLGASHPTCASLLNFLSEIYISKGKYEQAETMSRKALSIMGQTLGLDHQFAAEALLNLVRSLLKQGTVEDISSLINWALSNVEGLVDSNKHLYYRVNFRISIILFQLKQLKEAEAFYLRTLELAKQLFEETSSQILHILIDLSNCCLQQSKKDECNLYSREAGNIILRCQSEMFERGLLIELLELLADLRYKCKDFTMAEDLYKRAASLLELAHSQQQDNDQASLPPHDELAVENGSTSELMLQLNASLNSSGEHSSLLQATKSEELNNEQAA